MRIEPSGYVANLAQSLERRNTAAETTPEEMKESIKVSLSELGRKLSGKAEEKNKDIDDSDLPAAIKQLLKMIRELKAQIAEKQAELQALASDPSLDEDARRLKAEALQTELSTLNGALSSANANLIKLMREQGLSPEQMQTAASLAMG